MPGTQGDMGFERRSQESKNPIFVVRAPDPNKPGRWITLGYAWKRKHAQEGYSIKLNAVPVGNWDGALVLLPPYTDDDSQQSG